MDKDKEKTKGEEAPEELNKIRQVLPSLPSSL